MSTNLSPSEVFLSLVRGVAARRIDELPELCAEETHVVHPFDPSRAPPLLTRSALRAHFSRAPSKPDLQVEPANIRIHETRDPEVIVAEFEYTGENVSSGERFSYRCIFVMHVRNGQIVESRDYVDHLTSASVRGRLDDLLAGFKARLAGEKVNQGASCAAAPVKRS
jgi:uncharacterized protein